MTLPNVYIESNLYDDRHAQHVRHAEGTAFTYAVNAINRQHYKLQLDINMSTSTNVNQACSCVFHAARGRVL
jgi:hypothetical protein